MFVADSGMKQSLSFLEAAVSIGLVQGSGVNLVNAPSMAKAAGCQVSVGLLYPTFSLAERLVEILLNTWMSLSHLRMSLQTI